MNGNGDGSKSQNNTQPPANQEDQKNVSAISLKLSPFWTSCPRAWFVQTETQFNLRNILQDRTKFDHVVTALSQDVIMSVLDVIENPPATNMYKHLKDKLIERHTLTEERRLEALLSNTEMGDRKPSEFYRFMETMAGPSDKFNRDLLLKLWQRRLPTNINIALMSTGKTDTSEILTIADKIWDAAFSINSISAVNTVVAAPSHSVQPQPSTSTAAVQMQTEAITSLVSALNEMTVRLSNLERNVNAIHREPRGRFENRSRSRSRFRNQSGSRNCWYHRKFADNAIKCVPPCDFKNESQRKN